MLGVLPETYQPDPPADLYLPVQADPNSQNHANYLFAAARLRPGATLASARAEMKILGNAIARSIRKRWIKMNSSR